MIKSMVDYSLNMERNREVIRALKKRIAELENIINAQVFPSSGDGFSNEFIKGYEKALSDLDKILKEQGE
jgi:hypothetical protein